MSNSYFPTSLPGLHFAGRTTFYVNQTQLADSGARLVIRKYSGYRYRYTIRFLRSAQSEHSTLNTFFETHCGTFESFLLTDPVDSVSRRVRFVDDDLILDKQPGAAYYTGELELETVAT